jgi:NAD binding domain of 6-phosphogluconate dehydrogenase
MTHATLFGLGIAHNILKAGYPLTVYNRTQEKAAPLIEAGAQWADSPALVVLAAREVYKLALQLGLGDLDIAAISEVIRERQP